MKSRLLVLLVLFALLLVGLIPSNTAEAGTCRWHVVRRGENLTMISRTYGVTSSAIVRANGIRNASVIYAGQKLCIPTSGGSQPAPPSGTCDTGCYKTHYVKRGEYLKLIGSYYGVSASCLTQVNGLWNPNRIYPGQAIKVPVRCAQPPQPKPPQPKPQPTQGQWKGQYFTNRNLAGSPAFIRYVQDVNMDWGYGGPPGLGRSDDFSIRWTRVFDVQGGRYYFHVKSKDGVRVIVDGHVLINAWHDVGHPTNYQAEMDLSHGRHTIQVDYYNHMGPASVSFQFHPIGGGSPPDPSPGHWNAEYWNNTQLDGHPAWTTTAPDVVFDWGWGSPSPSIASDYFSARYTGEFHFSGGIHRFYCTSDDGCRIWLDDTLILDQWNIQARRTFTSDVDVSEGNHRIKVEYFENNGTAMVKALWSKR